jgi:hypothetical protein
MSDTSIWIAWSGAIPALALGVIKIFTRRRPDENGGRAPSRYYAVRLN